MKLSRRMLLAGTVGMAGATGAAAAGDRYHWWGGRQPARDLAALIRHRLGHLPLDPEGVERFASDYVQRHGEATLSVHHERTFGGLLRQDAVLPLLPARRRQDILEFERGLVSRYLLSTTYFRGPKGTPVRYVAFADPYELGCANPLANLTPDR